MKKTCLLSCFAALAITMAIPGNSFSQNVGIGTITPTRAKLEVHGAVDATSAIFGGESSGISIQRNWPGIGFNNYFNGGNRYIANGYGAKHYLDPNTGNMYLEMFGYGTANAVATVSVNSIVVGNSGNVGIRSNLTNATLTAAKAGNADGAATFSGTNYSSYFHRGFNEDTYIRSGKATGRVILNDIPNGITLLGANSSNVTEVNGKLFGYGGSPLAPALNLVPLGVVNYSGSFTLVSSGSFPASYENLVGNFVTGASGNYSNSTIQADYMEIILTLDVNIFNDYTMVIGINNLNFDGDSYVGGNALITRMSSNVIGTTYKIHVGVDDFGNVGPAEVGAMTGTVIFYGIR